MLVGAPLGMHVTLRMLRPVYADGVGSAATLGYLFPRPNRQCAGTCTLPPIGHENLTMATEIRKGVFLDM